MKYLLFFIFFLLLYVSCNGGKAGNGDNFFQWINQEKHGLVKTKYINGLQLNIKYLPAAYTAYMEWKDEPAYNRHQKDSILQLYKNNITFMLTIGPDERKSAGADIMLTNVSNYREYAERNHAMNFDMEEFITLQAGNKHYKPVLSSMENVYGLDSKRSILLVFSPSEKTDSTLSKAEKLDFIYNDELFDLGVNHFLFDRKDINNVPEFNFETMN